MLKNVLMNLFLTNIQLYTSQAANCWAGVVWIIVMFLSAIWTLILTAPIRCRGSIGCNAKFLQVWRNKLILDFHCKSINTLFLNRCFIQILFYFIIINTDMSELFTSASIIKNTCNLLKWMLEFWNHLTLFLMKTYAGRWHIEEINWMNEEACRWILEMVETWLILSTFWENCLISSEGGPVIMQIHPLSWRDKLIIKRPCEVTQGLRRCFIHRRNSKSCSNWVITGTSKKKNYIVKNFFFFQNFKKWNKWKKWNFHLF